MSNHNKDQNTLISFAHFLKSTNIFYLSNETQVAKFPYKVEMSGIDESRHFRNTFRDFDPANPDTEILTRSGLSDQYLRTLRFHRNRLLKRHYQEYSRCRDDDLTVYTGKFMVDDDDNDAVVVVVVVVIDT